MLGTLAGVAIGLGVAEVARGHREVEIGLVFWCIFWAFYLLKVFYVGMIFWFTALLAVLYGLLGREVPGLLGLRLVETLVGAGIGAAVSAFVVPIRTTQRVHAAAAGVLCEAADFLEFVLARRSEGEGGLLPRARRLDQKCQDLLALASSWQFGLFPADGAGRTGLVHDTRALVFYARRLVRIAPGLLEAHPELREAGPRLAGNARALARVLNGQPAPPIRPATDLLAHVDRSLAPQDAADARRLHGLRRVDQLLLQLEHEATAARQLGQGGPQ